ncbi:gamma-butyrobetaine,2-oxoglutarate dioxygenase [Nitratireductor sp. CAU 1489]|uniref:Gamma-butyrobetaine,2-oxoglutarate dioxygenase n=1 Tax=Nitratireductor arenosus TaxID=2682096 RepID=A0A844QJG9_9HYPH|nr:TauD/TfdA family dioxygenase [Nitratireductor arenosus]MVA98071.1 gamma-butyrobetaine,2-oxoglutarate dioxygenase [Nitratireductor arenosus]
MNVMQTATPAVSLSEKGLHVILADGQQAYFNYYWLRDNCPTSFDPATRERVFDIFHLDQPPRAETAAFDGDALMVRWQGEDHVTRMPVATLALYADGNRRPDPADLPRQAWYADHYPRMARFSQPELLADRGKVSAWIEAMIVDGVALVADMPDSDAGLTETAQLIGQVRPTFWGSYFDVRTHIKPTNLAYTAKALELHTDTPAEEVAPGVQFLHCRANSVEGGGNLFADGVAVANDFRAIDPEGFRLLSSIDIPFYCEHDGYDMRARQRVIELDDKNEVSGLTISQHLADMFDLPQGLLDDYYPAFCRFGKMLQDPRYVMNFRIKPGECITFDNHRIVHGRAAYSATSGERYLRGCYTDRAEMRSTYRALVGEGRFKT